MAVNKKIPLGLPSMTDLGIGGTLPSLANPQAVQVKPKPKTRAKRRKRNPTGELARTAFHNGIETAKLDIAQSIENGIAQGLTNAANGLINRGVSGIAGLLGGGVRQSQEAKGAGETNWPDWARNQAAYALVCRSAARHMARFPTTPPWWSPRGSAPFPFGSRE